MKQQSHKLRRDMNGYREEEHYQGRRATGQREERDGGMAVLEGGGYAGGRG